MQGGGVPPNPFAAAGGGAGGLGSGVSEGFANPFDEVGGAAGGGVTPPNPFAAAANSGSGFAGLTQNLGAIFQSGGLQGQGAGLAGTAAKYGIPLFQTAGGIEGLLQSRKQAQLAKQAALPNPGDVTSLPGYQAGAEAVQRSLAAQGYQGSGNMAAALQKYGGDLYNQYVNQRTGSAQAQSGIQAGAGVGTVSSLALLSQGARGLAGAF